MPSTTYKSADPFRKEHRPLTDRDLVAMARVKEEATRLLDTIHEHVPQGREKAIALTKLEESIMWATKGITA